MQLLSYMVQHYFNLKYENFTGKIIAALALFQVVKNPDEKDYKELEFIEENTDKRIMVSIYELDRNINPSKKDFVTTKRKISFHKRGADLNAMDDETKVTLTEGQIQYFLCKAIRRVNDIVCKNLMPYAEEMKLPVMEEEGLDATDIKEMLAEGDDEREVA